MTADRQQLTEIAVAATLAARAMPDFDHDEIGVWTIRSYENIVHGGALFGRSETVTPKRLVAAAEIADATIGRLTSILRRSQQDVSKAEPVVDADERAFADRISDVEPALVREISDASVDRLSHGWSEVAGIALQPVAGTFVGPIVTGSRSASMLLLATFTFTDGSHTQGHLTVEIDDVDDSLTTARLKAAYARVAKAA